jgi:hypothetical protein
MIPSSLSHVDIYMKSAGDPLLSLATVRYPVCNLAGLIFPNETIRSVKFPGSG